MIKRIVEHPILGKLEEKEQISFTFDGEKYEGYEGDTIASALLAQNIRTLRKQEETGSPRGLYCNIGHCYECRVTVDDASNVRACLTVIQEDMVVESGKVQPSPLHPDNEGDLPRTYDEFIQLEEQKNNAKS